ncbi:glycosyltransferase [Paenibacillus amylolyticus]|uniref:glycosyltransferase n=1 Tax=Paenibacillus amylolyticus TaxID=1451 RepID=UPI0007A0536F|nr:glycosyltransferase [Paenibacillus amylolyticus]
METNQEFERNIVFVSHDAHFNGAQLLSLHIIKALKQNFNYNIEMICQEGGILLTEFKKYANVHVLHPTDNKQETEKLIKRLSLKNYKVAISNTVISGGFVEVFHYNGIKTISMIHELPGVIKRYKAEKRAEQIATFSEKVIFPSDYVSQKFSEEVYRLDQEKTIILPQGLYKNNKYKNDNRTAREMLRRTLNLPDQASVVLGVGYADLRKGIDLFCEVATSVNDSNSDIIFVWVGNCNPDVMSSIPDRLKENVVFVPATPEVDLYYAGADLYLLTSREDPFPSVVMEAMNVGVPVIGFKDAGGFSDIVNENTGKLVDFLDTSGMTSEVIDLINNREQLAKKGQFGRELVEKQHYFMDYVYELLHLLGHEFKKVSVVLPNYNYERYLPERLDTIEKQTYPLYELLLLDDCSKDKSAQLIEEFSSNREIRVVKLLNSQNSGSVFKQWSKGIGEASGDYIWMAEADDLASPEFLEKVTVGFHKDSSVVMGYTQSKQMDSYGHILVDHYLDYTHDLDPLKWKSSYLNDGKKEISESLVIKNAIPNVSGTVFKKFDIQEILGELLEYKIAGDWLFYTWLLEKGNIYFNEQSLNYHRRHLNSVTISENNRLHYNEVVKMQDYIMARYEVTPTIQNKVNEYRVFLQEYLKLN